MAYDLRVHRVETGVWKRRYRYQAWVDGEFVGEYPTKKEATEKGYVRVCNNAERDAALSVEISEEHGL
jgi:hypothetical protein